MTAEPTSAEAAIQRAINLGDVGRTADALAEIQAALVHCPDHAGLHAVRALFLVDADRADQALEASGTAISLDPELGSAYTARARALIAAGGDQDEAVRAATTGLELDPDASAAFTTVRALLERANRGFEKKYRRPDVDDADEIARLITQEWPTSPLGPLALAMVSLARAGRLHYRTVYRWWLVALLVFVAPVGFVWLVADGIMGPIRRGPHLRDADRHLHAALALDPQNAHLQSLAADVLEMRHCWLRAVDYQRGAAALAADAVDADELVTPLARRITAATVIPMFAWPLAVDLLDGLMPRPAGILTGTCLALAIIGGVAAFRHAHARLLTPRLRLELDARAGPLVAAIVAVAELVYLAAGVLDTEPKVWFVAAAWVLPVAAILTGVLLVRFVSARRVVRPGDLSLLDGDELLTAVTRRVTDAIGVALASWFGLMAVVTSVTTSVVPQAVATVGLAGGAMGRLGVLRRRLRDRLPAGLRPAFDARPGPIIVAGVATLVAAVGATGIFDDQQADTVLGVAVAPRNDLGYSVGCLLVAPVAAFLFARLLLARHAALHPGVPLRRTAVPFLSRVGAKWWADLRRWAGGDVTVPQLPEAVRLSSPRRRLAACLLDVVLVWVTLGVGWLLWSLVTFRRGQSPGKQLLGLRVVSAGTGRVADYRTMVWRDFVGKMAAAAVTFTVFGAIVLFWLLWDGCRRQLWDKALQTLVVDDPRRVLVT